MAKAKLLDGRKLADKLQTRLVTRVRRLEAIRGRQLRLVTVLARENEAGRLYVAKKRELASRLGVAVQVEEVTNRMDSNELIESIADWNIDERIDGVMIQLPLSEALRPAWRQIVNSIYAEKDVDCLTAVNLGLIAQSGRRVLPATVRAVMSILIETGYEGENLRGVEACVVGASGMVGRPLAIYLQSMGATVIMCDEFTRDLGEYCRKSEVLISATGVPGIITGKMVRSGAVVVDVGITRQADGRLAGDVETASVSQVAGWVTPVPGGVGPVTVVSLLQNLISLIELELPE